MNGRAIYRPLGRAGLQGITVWRPWQPLSTSRRPRGRWSRKVEWCPERATTAARSSSAPMVPSDRSQYGPDDFAYEAVVVTEVRRNEQLRPAEEYDRQRQYHAEHRG